VTCKAISTPSRTGFGTAEERFESNCFQYKGVKTYQEKANSKHEGKEAATLEIGALQMIPVVKPT
jgi:hypothetical protein